VSPIPHVYPPAAPTISGDTLTISRFLNNPAAVMRRLRTLTENRFIADVLLSGRFQTTSGSILYEQSESIFTAKAPEAVAPGAQYPRTTAAPGTAALAAVVKWGQDVPVTDEQVGRYGGRAAEVALIKIANYIIKQVDTVSLAAIATAVTATRAAGSPGGIGTPRKWEVITSDPATSSAPLLDLMGAAAEVRALDQGYEPDIAVMTDMNLARLVANAAVIAGLAREDRNSVTAAGLDAVREIAGLIPLPTNNLPVATQVLVLDSTMLGGLGYERIPSPEYQGDPSNGVESFSRRDPDATDKWLIRGRRPVVPIVQEPGAGFKITGVST
jgi:hypothetical protein